MKVVIAVKVVENKLDSSCIVISTELNMLCIIVVFYEILHWINELPSLQPSIFRVPLSFSHSPPSDFQVPPPLADGQ